MTSLTEEGCRARQNELATWLKEVGLECAWISDPRHLMYLFNEYGRSIHPSSAVVFSDGRSVLVRPDFHTDRVFSDETIGYSPSRLSTLIADPATEAGRIVVDKMRAGASIGVDLITAPSLIAGLSIRDCGDKLRSMRRRKHPDEVAIIRRAILATEAGYAAVKQIIAPGVSELAVYEEFHRAAVESAGEAIGELGNDFRGGAMGGAPRQTPLVEGDLIPIDASVVLRHYNSDLCRTFAVSGTRSDLQAEAAEAVNAALAEAETMIKPGVSCAAVFQRLHELLDGWKGYRFPHHLGHGIGLNPHEAPRINPNWDDTFEVGDVFTLEPGVYGPALRAGIRTEQNYLLTHSGLERLSSFQLAP